MKGGVIMNNTALDYGWYIVGDENTDPRFRVITGKGKKTPNNMSINRWVHPIRSTEDINKCKEYLKNDFLSETGTKKMAAGRDYLLFVLGINFGIRVSDLIRIKYSDIFLNGKYRDCVNVKEMKTKKIRTLYINESVRNAIDFYLTETGIKYNPNDFLFVNCRTGKQITDRAVEIMIKRVTKECGIEGNYNTHSLRKTFAYHLYMRLQENGDPLALPKVQKMLNHRNQIDTLRYLGLQRDVEMDMMESLCL